MLNAELSMNFRISSEDLTEHGYPKWVAVEENTGLYGLGDSKASSISDLQETVAITLEFLAERGGVEAIRDFLEVRGVDYSEVQKTENGVLNFSQAESSLELVHASG